MIEEIFAHLPKEYIQGRAHEKKSYYFSMDGVKKTVFLFGTGCEVFDGKIVAKADCVCKTSVDFFLKVWQDGYRPSVKDFMVGDIKSNNPSELQGFLLAFGR